MGLFVVFLGHGEEEALTLPWPPLFPRLQWMHCSISAPRSKGGRHHLHWCSLILCRAQVSGHRAAPHHWQCHQNGKDKVSQQTSQSQPELAVTMRDWDVTGDLGPPCQPHRVPRRSHTLLNWAKAQMWSAPSWFWAHQTDSMQALYFLCCLLDPSWA